MNKVESFLKIATPIGAIVAFCIGIYHYRDAKIDEFRKTYWEKRYDVYERLTELSSHLATAADSIELDSLTHDFEILHSGTLLLVEDLHVFNAVQSFNKSLLRVVYPDSLKILQRKAKDIGHACRLSLKETWEPVPINELREMDK